MTVSQRTRAILVICLLTLLPITASPASRFDTPADIAQRKQQALNQRLLDACRRANRPDQAGNVERLLQQGANPDKRDARGMTALMWAVRASRPEIVDALIRYAADVDARDASGETALMKTRHEEIARLLLRAGATTTPRDRRGDTALHHAVAGGAFGRRAALVDALLRAGADAGARNNAGESVLISAVANPALECPACLSALLRHGARPNDADNRGRSPLMAAAASGGSKLFIGLLNAGAKPWSVDHDGNTALAYLARAPQRPARRMADILLAIGARDAFIHQARAEAKARGNTALASLLDSAAAP